MDSINKNQPEENRKNLYGEEAVKKIRELTDKASSCFFCTDIQTDKPFSVRPMSVQEIDDDGTFWFLSAIDSHKDQELLKDPHVQLLFQGSDYSDYLNIYGTASVSKDKQRIKELWKPMLKTWFTEGENDPRISVIKFTPETGYYWDTKHGNVVAGAKMLWGAMVGKTMDDSIEGRLDV